MDRITILLASALVDLFINIVFRHFPRKRPIYPQYGNEAPSSDDPKELPEGFLPVLMKFDGENFVSIDGSQRLQVKLPA